MKYKDFIKGSNCSLVRLKKHDEKIVEMFHSLFNESAIYDFLNHEYTRNNTAGKIRKWLDKKISSPYEVWYIIKSGRDCIGYICFKWRKNYNEACEISTAIEKKFRGKKLGYESSRMLVDYVISLNFFKYVVGYYYKTNKKAEMNLRKLGFKKANTLHKIITKEFYGSDGSSKEDRKYHLMVIRKKLN